MEIFAQVKPVPNDPILGLLDIFRSDPRPHKINLTVGVYQDESGHTPILQSVHIAEQRLLESETTKEYIGISGDPKLTQRIPDLLWPGELAGSRPKALATFQTLGGSGALRVVGDFFRCEAPSATVWISQPSWPNHPGIFSACGLKIANYRYFDAASSSIDITGMLDDLNRAKSGDAVILHGCCHNPTGVDLNREQWEAVSHCLSERSLFPVVDLAYQGFAEGLVQDGEAVRRLAELHREMFLCLSFSKTFGLYRERVGALVAVGHDPQSMEAVASRLRLCIRANYSNPPAHGGAIVAEIFADDALRSQWENELATMRSRIKTVRTEFARELNQVQDKRDFSFLENQHGLFAMTGLAPPLVGRLRDEHAIYIVENGRINLAGLNRSNLARVAKGIAGVL